MPKRKTTDIKFTKSNMQIIGMIALGSEGVISSNTFLNHATQTSIDRYCRDGYFEKKSVPDKNGKNYQTYYKTTEKFNTAFRKEFGKQNHEYIESRFSQSKSYKHSSGIEKVITAIDPRDMLKSNAVISSGRMITDEYDKFIGSKTYRNRAEELYQEHLQLAETYRQEIADIQSMEKMELENYTKLFELEDKLKHSQTIIDLYEGDDKFVSPPDAQITLTVDAFQSQIDTLKDRFENDEMSVHDRNSLGQTIEQMEQYMEEVTLEHKTVLTYTIEAVTDTYRNVDLVQKENWETITEQRIIYVRC